MMAFGPWEKMGLCGRAPVVADLWFSPRTERTKVREALGVAPAAVVMVTVAKLARRNGHLATLAALSKLHSSIRKRLIWLIVGEEDEVDYVDELKAGIAASNCDVRLMGSLPAQQIRDIYGAGDLFCLVSTPDLSMAGRGCDLVYLEAAACGLPSVAKRIGNAADTVINNETGRLVEPTPEAIADAIAELTIDGIKRISLGKRAWMRVRTMNWNGSAAEPRSSLPNSLHVGPPLESSRGSSSVGKSK